MTRIIFKDKNGKQTEAVSKQEFDSKINVNEPLFATVQNFSKWSDIIDNPSQNNALISIRDNTNHGAISYTAPIIGGNSAAFLFGGNDTHAMVSAHWDRSIVRFCAGNADNILWKEDVAWKSDIQALQERVSALEKQIGGVLSKLLAHLNNHLIRKVAF